MKLLKNKEVSYFCLVFFILTMTLTFFIFLVVENFIGNVNRVQISQNIAVVGGLVKNYPQQEQEIVENYISGHNLNYEFGKDILKKYSYDENLQPYKNSSMYEVYKKTYGRLILVIVLFVIILFLFFILSFQAIYNKIRKVSTGAESIIEGNYEPLSGDRAEGDFGLLIYQFNTMAERLNENVEALREEKIFLKRLITDISHQLKTPLASLIAFNDIISSDAGMLVEDRARFLNESRNQIERIEWLTKNLLKMAKLEAKVVEFDKEEAPISETISKSVRGLLMMAAEKGVIINMIGDTNIIIKHDVNWTMEALSNIIKNCIEHSANGCYVNISWEDNNVFTQIIIEDNGTGISKEELPKIFDRFHKGPNSNNPTNIGIGLYITRTIIEGQGGSIYANSQLGKGTRFAINLLRRV